MDYICTYGYHGTSQDRATQILGMQDFVDSKRNNEWLGTGVYFFAYLAHAKWWITHSRYENTPTVVLKATLKYLDHQLLDLDDPDILKDLNMIVEAYIRKADEAKLYNVDFRSQSLSNKWNFACNLIRRLRPQIGIISYTFRSNGGCGFAGYHETQRQYCVSDHSIISKIEIV